MEHTVCDDVTVYVLTGGKSERMGMDKALLRLPSGETMMEHAIAVGASVAREVCIVGPRERYAAYAWAGRIVEDRFPGQGPLAGIHAALKESQTEWNVMMAVDMPLVTTSLLGWMIARAKECGATVTVAETGGRTQTLLGVYRREFAEVAEQALKERRNKIEPLYQQVTTRIVGEAELREAAFGVELFGNCNTMEEMNRLFAVARSQGSE